MPDNPESPVHKNCSDPETVKRYQLCGEAKRAIIEVCHRGGGPGIGQCWFSIVGDCDFYNEVTTGEP